MRRLATDTLVITERNLVRLPRGTADRKLRPPSRISSLSRSKNTTNESAVPGPFWLLEIVGSVVVTDCN